MLLKRSVVGYYLHEIRLLESPTATASAYEISLFFFPPTPSAASWLFYGWKPLAVVFVFAVAVFACPATTRWKLMGENQNQEFALSNDFGVSWGIFANKYPHAHSRSLSVLPSSNDLVRSEYHSGFTYEARDTPNNYDSTARLSVSV